MGQQVLQLPSDWRRRFHGPRIRSLITVLSLTLLLITISPEKADTTDWSAWQDGKGNECKSKKATVLFCIHLWRFWTFAICSPFWPYCTVVCLLLLFASSALCSSWSFHNTWPKNWGRNFGSNVDSHLGNPCTRVVQLGPIVRKCDKSNFTTQSKNRKPKTWHTKRSTLKEIFCQKKIEGPEERDKTRHHQRDQTEIITGPSDKMLTWLIQTTRILFQWT